MIRIFGHSVANVCVLLLSLEMLACLAVFGFLPPDIVGADLALAERFLLALALAAAVGLSLGALGLYEQDHWSKPRRLLGGILLATLVAAATAAILLPPVHAAAALHWSSLLDILWRVTPVAVAARLTLILAGRLGWLQHRVAVVQGPDDAPVMAAGPELGRVFDDWFRIALVMDGRADAGRMAEELKARRIWALVAADPRSLPAPMRGGCAKAGVRIFSGAEFRERRLSRVEIESLPRDEAASAGAEPWASAAARRTLDILVSLTVLLVTLPVAVLAAIAIKLDSPGPVFYRQDRVGRDGRTFSILKFRSMCADAERGCGPRWASVGDARVTRVGRWLRLTRIDEIPQVLNVLRGDMAFVGPRPERPAFVQQLRAQIPHYDDRHQVKPGITGWAQVNMPYGASVEDARQKLAYDLYYVRRRSLFLDLLILIATVRVVLFREGAR